MALYVSNDYRRFLLCGIQSCPVLLLLWLLFIMNQCAQIGNEAGVFDLEFEVRDRFRRGL